MPSKYNEKFLRVDRMNRMEKARLDFIIRKYDREKLSLVHEIDREKKAVVKDFAHIKRTTGFSDEAIPSEEREDYRNDSFVRSNSSFKRLNSAKSARSSSRARTPCDYSLQSKYLRSSSQSSDSDDEVFITAEELYNLPPLPDMSKVADIERFEEELLESYKNVFKNSVISVKKSDRKNLNRFLKSRSAVTNGKVLRPHTAKATVSYERQVSLPIRPSTAYYGKAQRRSDIYKDTGSLYETNSNFSEKSSSKLSTSNSQLVIGNGHGLESVEEDRESDNLVSPSVKQLINQILEEEEISDKNTHCNGGQRTDPQPFVIPSGKTKPENGILRTRRISGSTNQTSDIETDSSGRIIQQGSIAGSRQRKVSINSLASGFDSSVISNMWGSVGDVSLDSNGQRKPSNWRKYVAAENAPIPETKRLVSLTTVVKAAMAFSKTARKRALDKLVEEQSMDTRQIIKEERLRRLQSRSNVLKSLSSQFSVDESKGPFALVE